MQLLSAVDRQIEEAPDHSIIVEGLQQWGDRSLARKHVAQKADKWNLIQTLPCCVSQKDRQADVDWYLFFIFSFNLSTCCSWFSNHWYSKYLNVDSADAEWVTHIAVQVKSCEPAVLLFSFLLHHRRLATKLKSAALSVFLKLLSKTNTDDYTT